MSTPAFHIVEGDTRTPLGRTLVQGGCAVDLTNLAVEFRMVAEDGTVVVDWETAVIVDRPGGMVQYDFASADVDTSGTFFYWFRIVEGGEYTTFPPFGLDDEAELAKIVIGDMGEE